MGCVSRNTISPLSEGLKSVPYTTAEMELYIETLTGTFFELRVSPFETIMSVQAKIHRLEGRNRGSFGL